MFQSAFFSSTIDLQLLPVRCCAILLVARSIIHGHVCFHSRAKSNRELVRAAANRRSSSDHVRSLYSLNIMTSFLLASRADQIVARRISRRFHSSCRCRTHTSSGAADSSLPARARAQTCCHRSARSERAIEARVSRARDSRWEWNRRESSEFQRTNSLPIRLSCKCDSALLC